jgi:membrane protein
LSKEILAFKLGNMNFLKTSKSEWDFVKQSAAAWMEDDAMTLSAALSYYTIFSIAPLILIAVAVTGLVFGEDATRGQIFSSLSGLLGENGAAAIQTFVQASSLKSSGIIATVVGVGTLLVGSTSAFAQLQDSLNQIWKVKAKPGKGIWMMVRQRLLSFSLILVIAFLLLVSLLVTAILSAVGKFASDHLPGGSVLWQVLNFAVSFGITGLLFAAIYKILPDVKLAWKDVWMGGGITAFFFTLGKLMIGLYLGHSGIASTYGAAGSAVIILLWTYYSTAVLFFGAEYTRFYSVRAADANGGRKLELKEGAAWMVPAKDASAAAAKASTEHEVKPA